VSQKNVTDNSATQDGVQPPQEQHQQSTQLATPQEPIHTQFNNPYLVNNNLSQLNNSDISLLNNTNPLVQPGIMSQLDRHLVLSSYAGMDPSSAAAITHTMGNQMINDGSINSGQAGYAANSIGEMHDMWNMDLSGMGMNGYGGMAPDASTAWFMPFNLDPPDIVGEDAGFSPAGLMGPGAYDFGMANFLGQDLGINSSIAKNSENGQRGPLAGP